ncbi:oxidoreductase [Cryobacterium sp. GrIS_2_6]|uniref:oxidoreductase n=1 Tax=Cryobacterium sp. GrIS_2_6 TaxID=3162785 RepID=UPI002E07F8A8|nr:oxidoreductase [Cryobacterium psychrotolerans]MEC5151858.1 NADP-dependent 3-hydroxy acid dehydrogenase YdfG [Cryobacterium psychrotolerans]
MTSKVALVTGASSGIGEATAREFLEKGYIVYAAARRTERMADLGQAGARTIELDVTDDASLTAAVDRIIGEAGRVDVLVNNAGYGSFGALEDVSLDEARAQFDVNIFGLARLTQLVLPHMREQKDGYVVNISSVGGKIWEPLGSWYHATKFAVEGLSNSLRVEVARFGIKVVIIEPGVIRSEWSDISADHLEATSTGTAYSDQAAGVARALRGANNQRLASEPQVVATAIGKAVSSRRPRTRYAVGGGAGFILFVQRLLTDRGFDRFIARTIGAA